MDMSGTVIVFKEIRVQQIDGNGGVFVGNNVVKLHRLPRQHDGQLLDRKKTRPPGGKKKSKIPRHAIGPKRKKRPSSRRQGENSAIPFKRSRV